MIPEDQEVNCSQVPFKFRRRYIFYGLSILYLVGDIYWFGGPLKSRIDETLKGNRVDVEQLAIREEIVAKEDQFSFGKKLCRFRSGFFFGSIILGT